MRRLGLTRFRTTDDGPDYMLGKQCVRARRGTARLKPTVEQRDSLIRFRPAERHHMIGLASTVSKRTHCQESRLDIHRNGGEFVECPLHRRAHDAEPLAERL